jgi:hypothetical protein
MKLTIEAILRDFFSPEILNDRIHHLKKQREIKLVGWSAEGKGLSARFRSNRTDGRQWQWMVSRQEQSSRLERTHAGLKAGAEKRRIQ